MDRLLETKAKIIYTTVYSIIIEYVKAGQERKLAGKKYDSFQI